MEIISAIATAQGAGGVAIVRLSGEGCLCLAKKMFSYQGEYEPNMLYPGVIDCGEFSDYGMCVYFRAPRSFTGEDTVEFHCHGGVEIARGVLKRTLLLGARMAERGEFTRRAFLNGKLSLSAAEGMADMISAQSLSQVRAGFLLYGEKLTKEGKRLQNLLKDCLAGVDADVDYPEEDLSHDTREEVGVKLQEICSSLQLLLGQYKAGRKIKSGVNVVLCGKPNAGKSSLLNTLLGYERAIVSSVPGTTRDIVEGTLELHGVLFHITDTAGLREGCDEIEREGIRRAENALKGADLVVYLKEDEENLSEIPADAEIITLASKSDLRTVEGVDLSVSSLTGEGIEELKELLYERGFGKKNDGAYLLEERHLEALKEALREAQNAFNAVNCGLPAELYAEHLNAAWTVLGVISGETATEEIIGEIFAKFCVGK